MFVESWTRYLALAKMQMKLCLISNAVLALLFACIIPLAFGIQNLDGYGSSVVLERYFSVEGIILLTPLFRPEQDSGVRETVESKYTSAMGVVLIRLVMSIILLGALILIFAGIMQICNSTFDPRTLIPGAFITALLLGSLGFAAYAVSDNLVIGYLLPLGCFMVNFMSGTKLGNFYLFSLANENFTPKYWLLGSVFLLFMVGFTFRIIERKVR